MAPSAVERLRTDIDSGRTHDKVSGPDPAAAPLGADEEAAGTPISDHAAQMARNQEVSGPPRSNEDGGLSTYLFALVMVAGILTGATFLLLR